MLYHWATSEGILHSALSCWINSHYFPYAFNATFNILWRKKNPLVNYSFQRSNFLVTRVNFSKIHAFFEFISHKNCSLRKKNEIIFRYQLCLSIYYITKTKKNRFIYYKMKSLMNLQTFHLKSSINGWQSWRILRQSVNKTMNWMLFSLSSAATKQFEISYCIHMKSKFTCIPRWN